MKIRDLKKAHSLNVDFDFRIVGELGELGNWKVLLKLTSEDWQGFPDYIETANDKTMKRYSSVDAALKDLIRAGAPDSNIERQAYELIF